MFVKILAAIKMLDFGNYSTKSKYYDNSNKLVIGKMKDETAGIAIKKLVGLKPKMYSFLEGNGQHKKVKGVNRNTVSAISQNDYKDVLSSNKYIRHLMNRIQIKDPRIKRFESKKVSLSFFDDKIYIQNNGYISETKYISKSLGYWS